MLTWVKRKWHADKALDTAMSSVVEYYYFSSMKPPPRPDDASLSAPPTPPPSTSLEPSPPSTVSPPSPVSPPFSVSPTPPPTSPSPPPITSPTLTSPMAPSHPLTYAEWQSERAEILALDNCAVQATWRIGSTATFASLLAMLWRHRQGKTKIGIALSGVGVFIFTGAVSWSVWGKRCATEFLQSEGRVADRGRAVLRREMEDHPLLEAYEAKHRQQSRAADPVPPAAPTTS